MTCAEAKIASNTERAAKGLSGRHLTYGEIKFQSIAECFYFIKHKYGAFPDPPDGRNTGVFVDLGHGTGKGILAAALLHPFESCEGIELIENLVHSSKKLKCVYQQAMAVLYDKGIADCMYKTDTAQLNEFACKYAVRRGFTSKVLNN